VRELPSTIILIIMYISGHYGDWFVDAAADDDADDDDDAECVFARL